MTVFFDIEASGLHRDGIPIEIGVARVHPDHTIECCAWLIRPHPDWIFADGSHWDPVAVEIHGIVPSDLQERGQTPAAVVDALDAFLGGPADLFCDGYESDKRWLEILYDGADRAVPHRVRDVMELDRLQRKATPMLAKALWERKRKEVESSTDLAHHRAGPDAERLARTYVNLVANAQKPSTPMAGPSAS